MRRNPPTTSDRKPPDFVLGPVELTWPRVVECKNISGIVLVVNLLTLKETNFPKCFMTSRIQLEILIERPGDPVI